MPQLKKTIAKVTIKKIITQTDLQTAFAIRKQVFVTEQNCPVHLEFENEELSHYFWAFVDDIPAGVCRWRQTPNGYKCERFAFLKQFRSLGVGTHLLTTLLAHLPLDANYIYLHAQLTAVGLYTKFVLLHKVKFFMKQV